MTSFTKCSGTSFTLPRERSERWSVTAMAWKTMEVKEQRVDFVVMATPGGAADFCALCRVWHLTADRLSVAENAFDSRGGGHVERSRRPHESAANGAVGGGGGGCGAHGYPDWGARKLAVLLSRRGIELPRKHDSPHSAASWHGAGRGSAPAGGHSGLSAGIPTSCGRWTSKDR